MLQDELTSGLAASVAACLEELVEHRGWSYLKLSHEIGITSQTLRNWRKQRLDNPKLRPVARLHQLAGLSLDAGLGIDGALLVRQRSDFDARVRRVVAEQLAGVLTRGMSVAPPQQQAVPDWFGDTDKVRVAVDEIQLKLQALTDALNQRKAS